MQPFERGRTHASPPRLRDDPGLYICIGMSPKFVSAAVLILSRFLVLPSFSIVREYVRPSARPRNQKSPKLSVSTLRHSALSLSVRVHLAPIMTSFSTGSYTVPATNFLGRFR